jgi:hypothetical protein
MPETEQFSRAQSAIPISSTEHQTMLRRLKRAFRVAGPPSLVIVIVGAYVLASRWSNSADDAVSGVAIVAGLALVVFLTYFVLAMTGFTASPEGIVDAPRIYVWAVLCAIVVLVFGVLFYVLQRHS